MKLLFRTPLLWLKAINRDDGTPTKLQEFEFDLVIGIVLPFLERSSSSSMVLGIRVILDTEVAVAASFGSIQGAFCSCCFSWSLRFGIGCSGYCFFGLGRSTFRGGR